MAKSGAVTAVAAPFRLNAAAAGQVKRTALVALR